MSTTFNRPTLVLRHRVQAPAWLYAGDLPGWSCWRVGRAFDSYPAAPEVGNSSQDSVRPIRTLGRPPQLKKQKERHW
jgi:hypothetical protein